MKDEKDKNDDKENKNEVLVCEKRSGEREAIIAEALIAINFIAIFLGLILAFIAVISVFYGERDLKRMRSQEAAVTQTAEPNELNE